MYVSGLFTTGVAAAGFLRFFENWPGLHLAEASAMQKGQLLPEQHRVREVASDTMEASNTTLKTRDHDVIRQWASRRGADPATGEATASGHATVAIADTGAGIR